MRLKRGTRTDTRTNVPRLQLFSLSPPGMGFQNRKSRSHRRRHPSSSHRTRSSRSRPPSFPFPFPFSRARSTDDKKFLHSFFLIHSFGEVLSHVILVFYTYKVYSHNSYINQNQPIIYNLDRGRATTHTRKFPIPAFFLASGNVRTNGGARVIDSSKSPSPLWTRRSKEAPRSREKKITRSRSPTAPGWPPCSHTLGKNNPCNNERRHTHTHGSTRVGAPVVR